MIVAGIDPGPARTAVVVWDGSKIIYKVLTENRPINFMVPLHVDVVAVEHLQCFGMPVGSSVFETAYYIGELRNDCRRLDIPFRPVFRSEVKAFWCRSPRAKDSNIRTAIIDRLGPPGTKGSPGVTYGVSKDLWSALAIAMYAHDVPA